MKFGRTLRENTLKEWRFYSVDYKQLKQALKRSLEAEEDDRAIQNDRPEFFDILNGSKSKISKFYEDKEKWALEYMKTLEDRVHELKVAAGAPLGNDAPAISRSTSLASSTSSLSSGEGGNISTFSPTGVMESLPDGVFFKTSQNQPQQDGNWLKEEYRRVAASPHFKAFIYAKKSLKTFERELSLLLEFLSLNQTAFGKILKKFDKHTGSCIRDEHLAELAKTHSFMDGHVLKELMDKVISLLDQVQSLKPELPPGWESRKVFTIGCFDLFHRGHQNVLMALREFGCYIVAGIHDDESYFKLKNKYTIDNLETRMRNVKPYVDQLYVIASTDPLLYIQSMVSPQDIASGSCCYARGDDMLQFPGREWVESVMPVHFVPRTEACSSTLIRTIYHSESSELREKAAYAKTRYDGKPVDENGNVLKFSAPVPASVAAS